MLHVLPKGVTAEVDCGDGASMSIVNPYHEYSVEWALRYGCTDSVRFVSASLLSSYDYLLSGEITTREAIRRLQLMRARRVALRDAALSQTDGVKP